MCYGGKMCSSENFYCCVTASFVVYYDGNCNVKQRDLLLCVTAVVLCVLVEFVVSFYGGNCCAWQ